MTTKKNALLIGCLIGGVFLLIASVIGILLVVFVYHVSQDPEGMAVDIQVPDTVVVGEDFSVIVTVTNERNSKPLKISDIDFSANYLDSFLVRSTNPKPTSSMSVPLADVVSYSFNHRIASGESRTYTFQLRAVEEGLFIGDIDVYEGQQLLTNTIQTWVESGSGDGDSD